MLRELTKNREMTTEERIASLQNAVTQLTAEIAASRKKEQEAAAACQDLRTRLEVLSTQRLPATRPEGIGLGNRGGSLVSHFNGDLQEYPNFRADVIYTLQLLDKDFKNEGEKVGFIISHLRGEAKSWLRNLWRDKDPALQNAAAFIKVMDACFLSEIDVDIARREIHGLRQGKATVRQYHSRFFGLVNVLAWEKESPAVRDLFWEGLSGAVKDEIARGGRPQTTKEVVERALSIGVRLEGRPWGREEGHLGRTPAKGLPPFPKEAARARSMPPLGGGEEPMEIGGAKAHSTVGALTPGAVKMKPPRGTRKCYICDSAQHMAKECPQRFHKHTAAAATVTDAIQQRESQQENSTVWLEMASLGTSQTSQ